MKIAAVNNCVEVLSNSIAKLPFFVMDYNTKKHLNHSVLDLLSVRPNEVMTPSVFKKLIECQRLLKGNAYIYIERDGHGKPQRLVPLPPDNVSIEIEKNFINYIFTENNGKKTIISGENIIHLKAYSEDGIHGISVLERARQTIDTAGNHQSYENNFFRKNARPSGVLTIPTLLASEAKDKISDEWEKRYSGIEGMFRPAILDGGLDYKQMGISQRDSQFIESKEVSVQDICRFFNVPLYKVQAGKQSYNSNEQNAIEYVGNTLAPIVIQYEEEFTYKLFTDSEIRQSIEIKCNMNAELRGDYAARAQFYKSQREVGALSANDIRAYEDLESIEGGDIYLASLNYCPLDLFEEMTKERNIKKTGGED